MVVAAAAADGVTFEQAQAGGGLTRVGYSCVSAFGLPHIGGREGGDAGETLREVEGDALGLEDAASWAMDGCDDGAGGEGIAVSDVERQ